jgi:hypothetical protein
LDWRIADKSGATENWLIITTHERAESRQLKYLNAIENMLRLLALLAINNVLLLLSNKGLYP